MSLHTKTAIHFGELSPVLALQLGDRHRLTTFRLLTYPPSARHVLQPNSSLGRSSRWSQRWTVVKRLGSRVTGLVLYQGLFLLQGIVAPRRSRQPPSVSAPVLARARALAADETPREAVGPSL